ncbi:MAG TPA: hypothetical protein VGB23_01235, partial [Nitrospirota bacterium]
MLVLPCITTARADEEAEVVITTEKAYENIGIAIPDFVRENEFVDHEQRDVKMADILADDLAFSGYFKTQRVHEIKGDVKGWASLGVSYVVQGGYSTDGREIQVSCRIVDTSIGRVIWSGSYPDALRVMRQKVHEMADDIIFRVAGEKGVCRTKIAFCSDMTGHDELYYSDYDGHNAYRLTRDEGTCLLPGWSPSGNYITYTSYKRANPDLWWVSRTGKSRGILSFHDGLN